MMNSAFFFYCHLKQNFRMINFDLKVLTARKQQNLNENTLFKYLFSILNNLINYIIANIFHEQSKLSCLNQNGVCSCTT